MFLMSRFVVLLHDHPFLHWDFFLERGSTLKAWRLLAEPSVLPVTAERNADHRLHYLDYEGPVSNGRGEVTRWDAGDYEIIEQSEQRWLVQLDGCRLSGRFEIAFDAITECWTFDRLVVR